MPPYDSQPLYDSQNDSIQQMYAGIEARFQQHFTESLDIARRLDSPLVKAQFLADLIEWYRNSLGQNRPARKQDVEALLNHAVDVVEKLINNRNTRLGKKIYGSHEKDIRQALDYFINYLAQPLVFIPSRRDRRLSHLQRRAVYLWAKCIEAQPHGSFVMRWVSKTITETTYFSHLREELIYYLPGILLRWGEREKEKKCPLYLWALRLSQPFSAEESKALRKWYAAFMHDYRGQARLGYLCKLVQLETAPEEDFYPRRPPPRKPIILTMAFRLCVHELAFYPPEYREAVLKQVLPTLGPAFQEEHQSEIDFLRSTPRTTWVRYKRVNHAPVLVH